MASTTFYIQSGGSLPGGGTAGQFLIKNSSSDNDATWQDLPLNKADFVKKSGDTVTGQLSFTSEAPLLFFKNGSGTYNRGVMYINSTEMSIETPRASDSDSAEILPFSIRTSGVEARALIETL